jgi:cytosine/uracil/thiamine/allantoin permease
MARQGANAMSTLWRNIPFPAWLRYLHFHEIQRSIGLPTSAFIAFMIGLGCVAGAIGVSLFYRASNLAEFQAIQMWRIEWLLGATAAFVAGILLKKPSDVD